MGVNERIIRALRKRGLATIDLPQDILHLMLEAADAIEGLEKELADQKETFRWRSVKDDPPEYRESVIYADAEEVSAGYLGNYDTFYDLSDNYYFVDATHWMKFPAKPEVLE